MDNKPLVAKGKGLKPPQKKTYSKVCGVCNVVPFLVQGILYCPNKRRMGLDLTLPEHRGMKEYNIVSRCLPCSCVKEKKKT